MEIVLPVNGMEMVDGKLQINLSATASNDDWIRAARLLKEGKQEEFDKLDNEQMVYFTEES